MPTALRLHRRNLKPKKRGGTVYVAGASDGSLTPIPIATNIAGSPLSVDYAWDIAITPDGSIALVTSHNGNTVAVINLATFTAATPITVGFSGTWWGIVITPDGKKAYLSRSTSTGLVYPIDLTTMTVGTAISVAAVPASMAITPDGSTVYVLCGTQLVVPINVATNTAGTAINLGTSSVLDIAITPDGTTAYVTAVSTGSAAQVIPITLATATVGTPITFGVNLQGIAISPDGTKAYVCQDGGTGGIYRLNIPANTVGSLITTDSNAFDVAFSRDGSVAYVATATTPGNIRPVTVATDTPASGPPIAAGSNLHAVAIF